MENGDERSYQMCGKVVLRRIGDESLLVPVSGPAAGGRVYPVNDSARVIWSGLQDGHTVGEVVRMLVETFDVDVTEAAEDCRACIDLLVTENLIEECCS